MCSGIHSGARMRSGMHSGAEMHSSAEPCSEADGGVMSSRAALSSCGRLKQTALQSMLMLTCLVRPAQK